MYLVPFWPLLGGGGVVEEGRPCVSKHPKSIQRRTCPPLVEDSFADNHPWRESNNLHVAAVRNLLAVLLLPFLAEAVCPFANFFARSCLDLSDTPRYQDVISLQCAASGQRHGEGGVKRYITCHVCLLSTPHSASSSSSQSSHIQKSSTTINQTLFHLIPQTNT
jgi:hypothetical protein